jgi:seryl-tRNA synthetase
MLDIKVFRETPDLIRKDLEKRKDPEKLGWVDKVIEYDREYRKALAEAEELRKSRNRASEEINQLKKAGKDATAKIAEMKQIPQRIKDCEERLSELSGKITYYRMRIPNILHDSVPFGEGSEDNEVVRTFGTITKPEFELKVHSDIIEALGGGNFKKATEVSGAGFYYLMGDIALLDQAVQQFAIKLLSKKGYTLVEPPFLLGRKAYEGVTDLADFENVMYKIEGSDLYLIATSEHPICALFMDENIDESKLPIKLMGTSACFRKEIGSHGVDSRGIFRVHQFTKIEQFIFCKPEDSWKYHEELIKNAEEIFRKLEIPYRVVNICTGDIGTVAAKKYDIEAWYPREQEYKEVVSCSNCTAYQAVRMNIRSGKEYVHTLNSTAVATGRALRAIIENFQNPDGTVRIPKALQPYMGRRKVIGQVRK